MKRIIILCLISLMLMSLVVSSCKQKISARLKVGMNVEFPPFEYRQDNDYLGVDIDIIKSLAQRLDFDYEFIDMDFEKIIPALRTGEIDLAISALTITEARKLLVDFSTPYFKVGQVFLKRSDSNINVSRLEELAPYRIGTLNLTTNHTFVKEKLIVPKILPERNLTVFRSNNEVLAALLNDRIDFAVFDNITAYSFMEDNPLAIALEVETNEQYGIAFPKASPYYESINGELQKMLEEGEIDRILSKHGLDKTIR